MNALVPVLSGGHPTQGFLVRKRMTTSTHSCLNRVQSTEPSWWESDAQGIPLCRVCTKCRAEKLSGYRSIVLTGYTQADVDEPIEPEDNSFERDDMP
jgi:hypothetical protein